MRVAVISCWKYRDAWTPFFELVDKFWPANRWIDLITDEAEELFVGYPMNTHFDVLFKAGKNVSWSQALAEYAKRQSGPVLLMQEDFWLNAPVNQSLVDHALDQMKSRNAGMIRLYPCPGADEDYGDEHYGIVKKGSKYRINCQSSIWRPDYLHAIASRCGSTPRDFELNGTKIAESLPDEVLAFKRESGPPAVQYLCSAISRSQWNPDAKTLCDLHGIEVDWSLRGFQAA